MILTKLLYKVKIITANCIVFIFLCVWVCEKKKRKWTGVDILQWEFVSVMIIDQWAFSLRSHGIRNDSITKRKDKNGQHLKCMNVCINFNAIYIFNDTEWNGLRQYFFLLLLLLFWVLFNTSHYCLNDY